MPYRFTAVGADGKKQSGTLEVGSEREALERLAAMGLTPVSLNEGSADVPWWQRDISLKRTAVNDTVLQSFLFDLSTMMTANMALLPSIEMILTRTSNKQFRTILSGALVHLKNGQSLSASLARVEPDFDPEVLMALQIGEQSNTLAEACTQTAASLEAGMRLRANIISAAIYPTILLGMAGVVLYIVLFYLLPILEPLFAGPDTGSSSPLAALLAVRTVTIFLFQGLIVLGLIGLVAFPFLKRRGYVTRALDALPVIGTLRQSSRSQVAARTISNILLSGGDIDAALGLVVKSAPAGFAKDQMKDVRQKVQDGMALSTALGGATAYDDTLQQMAALGEKGEQVPELMQVAAQMLEGNMRKRLEQMVGMLVPILTVVVGVIVGGLVMMTIGAVLSINDLAQ